MVFAVGNYHQEVIQAIQKFAVRYKNRKLGEILKETTNLTMPLSNKQQYLAIYKVMEKVFTPEKILNKKEIIAFLHNWYKDLYVNFLNKIDTINKDRSKQVQIIFVGAYNQYDTLQNQDSLPCFQEIINLNLPYIFAPAYYPSKFKSGQRFNGAIASGQSSLAAAHMSSLLIILRRMFPNKTAKEILSAVLASRTDTNLDKPGPHDIASSDISLGSDLDLSFSGSEEEEAIMIAAPQTINFIATIQSLNK